LKFVSWVAIVAIVAVLFGVRDGVAQDSGLATVKVAVSDTFGAPVQGAKLTLTSIGPNEKFTALGGEANFERIPYGRYDLEVRLTGFEPRKERIRVYQPRVVFRVGLELGASHSYQRPNVFGSVGSDLKGRSDLWVRFMAIYSGDLVENAVDSLGHFEFDGMAAGKYLLFLVHKDQVLSMKPVDILGGKQVIEVTIEPK